MSPKWKERAGDAALAVVASLITLVMLEHVVFRFLLVPDDLLRNVTINGVVRYEPMARAVFRQADGTETLVTINEHGWNASRQRYEPTPPLGVTRIAVVGDSYVHASFVNPDEAFPELLERRLKADGIPAEVLRFGMDGAPLSQYLHMLRNEVVRFRPDLVVIPLIHNDFDEIYRLIGTRTESSFLKIVPGPGGRDVEIAPTDFTAGLADRLRELRTFRYLYYETGLYLSLKPMISRLFWGGSEDWSPEFISSAVDIRKINDHDKNRHFAGYVLREIKALAAAKGFRVAFVMDGVREAVYEGRDPEAYEVGRLNAIARDLTTELDLPFLDLQAAFARDYAVHRERFEFSYDWHWNRRGNAVVAAAIADLIKADRRLITTPLRHAQRPAGEPTAH